MAKGKTKSPKTTPSKGKQKELLKGQLQISNFFIKSSPSKENEEIKPNFKSAVHETNVLDVIVIDSGDENVDDTPIKTAKKCTKTIAQDTCKPSTDSKSGILNATVIKECTNIGAALSAVDTGIESAKKLVNLKKNVQTSSNTCVSGKGEVVGATRMENLSLSESLPAVNMNIEAKTNHVKSRRRLDLTNSNKPGSMSSHSILDINNAVIMDPTNLDQLSNLQPAGFLAKKRKISETIVSNICDSPISKELQNGNLSDDDFVVDTPIKDAGGRKRKVRKRNTSPTNVELPTTSSENNAVLPTDNNTNLPVDIGTPNGNQKKKFNRKTKEELAEEMTSTFAEVLNMPSPFKIVITPEKNVLFGDQEIIVPKSSVSVSLFNDDTPIEMQIIPIQKSPQKRVRKPDKPMNALELAHMVEVIDSVAKDNASASTADTTTPPETAIPENISKLKTCADPSSESSTSSSVQVRSDSTYYSAQAGSSTEVRSDSTYHSAQAGSSTGVEGMLDDLFLHELDFDAIMAEHEVELSLERLQRCEVLSMSRLEGKRDKIVKLRSLAVKTTTSCMLKETWADYSLAAGDIVSISGGRSTSDEARWYLDSKVGLLVLHPDRLVSGTTVVGSLFCQRRAVLSSYYQGVDSANRVMVIGIVVHDLLQKSIQRKLTSSTDVTRLANELLTVPRMIMSLYSSELTLDQTLKEVLEFVPHIVKFVKTYVTKTLGSSPRAKSNWQGEVSNILDIEENVWAPTLGLKGKIDVSAEVTIHARGRRAGSAVLPIEIKTGRASKSAEHKGQVMLYEMMMTETGRPVDTGLLLYIRSGEMDEVKLNPYERAGLIHLRNRLVRFLEFKMSEPAEGGEFEPISLPEPINHHNACEKCPYLTLCSTMLQRDGMDRVADNNPLKPLISVSTNHLSPAHINYFVHWSALLLLEETEPGPANQMISDLWTLTPEQREARGTCLCRLSIVGHTSDSTGRHVYTLSQSESDADLRSFSLAAADYVALNSGDRVALYTGTILEITQHTVSVLVDRLVTLEHSALVFNMDAAHGYNSSTFFLTCLGLLTDNSEQAAKLRSIVIDRRAPVLGKVPGAVLEGRDILSELNRGQQKAVLTALSTEDYLLIKGMPGSGKTSTIAALVCLLVSLGHSVLLVSHTHSAVDNLMLKLLDRGVDMLRLGAQARIHPRLRDCSEAGLLEACGSTEELHDRFMAKLVVGSTCMGSNHPLLTRRRFHMCIVDESTQVVQSGVLRSLYAADKFVLVGDPEQLAPLVRNKRARSLGLGESLFSRLDGEATLSLHQQYRMNAAITAVANGLTYDGELKCGSDEVANATINITRQISVASWLNLAVSTELRHSVIFLDTGCTQELRHKPPTPAKQREAGSTNGRADDSRETSIKNICEAAVVLKLLQAFKQGGIGGGDIGVIAPYRAQVALLGQLVEAMEPGATEEPVEVNTVDQYQGRDKHVIVYSCTRSDPRDKQYKNQAWEILGDKKRLTVAMTRAKHKLVVVGDAATLSNYQPFKQLLSCVDERQIVPLHDGYDGFSWKAIVDETRALLKSNAG